MTRIIRDRSEERYTNAIERSKQTKASRGWQLPLISGETKGKDWIVTGGLFGWLGQLWRRHGRG